MREHRVILITIAFSIVLASWLMLPVINVSSSSGNNICDGNNIYHTYATYVAQPNITIDGVANESAWHLSNVYTYTILLSNSFEPSNPLIQSTMHMKFIYDRTSLYILAEWNDSTIDFNDMAMFCWNINCSNYTSCMFNTTGGMETPHPGERVDSWQFPENGRSNMSIAHLIDKCFDDQGWLGTDNPDVLFGFIYGTWLDGTYHYLLEMRRLMRTADCSIPAVDAEFKENVPVRFSTAIEDNSANQAHAISATCDLNLTTNPLPDNYQPPQNQTPPASFPYTALIIILGIGVGAMVAIIVIWRFSVTKSRKTSI